MASEDMKAWMLTGLLRLSGCHIKQHQKSEPTHSRVKDSVTPQSLCFNCPEPSAGEAGLA